MHTTNQSITLPNLAAFGYWLSRTSQTLSDPVLIVTPDQAHMEHLYEILQFFGANTRQILCFPDYGILPYERLSPPAERIYQRINTLTQLTNLSHPTILLATVPSLLQRLSPKHYIESHCFQFKTRMPIQLATLQTRLINNGYQRVTHVLAPGEFSIRGAILDIFPIHTASPFRLESAEDHVESLRFFNPETRKTGTPCHHIELMPAREFSMSELGLTRFRTQWPHYFGTHTSDSPVYTRLSTNSCPPGIEHYLPLFFETTHALLDYLPPQTVVIDYHNTSHKIQKNWELIQARYEQWRYDKTWPLLPPEQLYYSPEILAKHLTEFKRHTIHFDEFSDKHIAELTYLPFSNTSEPLKRLPHFVHEHLKTPNAKLLFCAKGPSEREVLLDRLKSLALSPTPCADWQDFLERQASVQITLASIRAGFAETKENIALISAQDIQPTSPLITSTLTDHPNVSTPYQSAPPEFSIELKVGDLAIHADHGIGQYIGLERLSLTEHEAEFITLLYANGAKLYTPIAECHLIHRYSGPSHTPLHALNTDRWQKTKRKALTQLRDVAAELLALYAQRAAHTGYAFPMPNADYQQFVAHFPFETTPDQATAIQQVIQDLCRPSPMDRLICGDVGFGKTEVAMRAAFLVANSGKQVVVLAPTTLLAEQHYRTFQNRFDGWPMHIDWISRFRTTSEIKKILKKWQEGKLDILIGTHALLNNKIAFPNLGLIIIDEEHHFGVQQKEAIRKLRANIDLLTLTATPIPRTLQMAVSGLRELSIIATPPKGRLPIKSVVTPRQPDLIREALLRELLRGGQVYFVHNHIDSLEKTAREIQALVPEARLTIAHGQLPEHELETRMADFYHQRSTILICTSIIETGLDIPTANTLIVDRAHHFGLAQLHQLRGRVGRSRHQAYAYFLAPHENAMTQEAIQRLEALGSLTELGVGFNIASYDLDIRGAGELLGEQQSGTLQGIGFSLYMELLEQTVAALKAGKETLPTLSSHTVELHIPAFIPEDYLPDVGKRLSFYKRIAKTTQAQALATLRTELQDRYGALPETVRYLFQITELKWRLTQLGIQKIEFGPKGGKIEFEAHPSIEPLVLIRLIQSNSTHYQLKNASSSEEKHQVLQIKQSTTTPEERIEAIHALLDQLSKQ